MELQKTPPALEPKASPPLRRSQQRTPHPGWYNRFRVGWVRLRSRVQGSGGPFSKPPSYLANQGSVQGSDLVKLSAQRNAAKQLRWHPDLSGAAHEGWLRHPGHVSVDADRSSGKKHNIVRQSVKKQPRMSNANM